MFNHPNVGPFISRQLIQQLVTSNPSPAYVAAVAAVFNDNGAGVRGDLAAVVPRDPDASGGRPDDDRRPASWPSRCCSSSSPLRALAAIVADHPFMSDKAEAMGQKVFYPPLGVQLLLARLPRARHAAAERPPLGGPEFQILTAVTALERANFVGALLGG